MSSCILSAIACLGCFMFTSCFTGIESTKKVSLSREDKKNLEPTQEEIYFQGVAPQPLSEWKKGKRFIAADNKTLLIFNQHGLPANPDSAHLGGTVLYFEGVDQKLEPDGSISASIIFHNSNSYYRYDSGKTFSEAPSLVMSDKIPMMIDLDMVDEAKELLTGNSYWIRTPLWYDKDGNRINGKKFVPVTISEVTSGTIAFPLKIKFKDSADNEAWIFMNYGNSGKESRSFSNLFFLTDIRKRYPSITDEVWDTICNGSVILGMTKEECKLSLGTPVDVNRGHDYSQTLDLWQYPNGTALWFEDGLLTRFRR